MDNQQPHYHLKWNRHDSSISDAFKKLRVDTTLMDVTLNCEGGSVKAHKLVLCACSTYFESALKHAATIEGSPIIMFLAGVPIDHLKTILDFMYTGELTVPKGDLEQLFNSARLLQVKGLYQPNNDMEQEDS